MSVGDLGKLFGWRSHNNNISLENDNTEDEKNTDEIKLVEETKIEGALEMKTNGDKASYAIGVGSGQSIKTQFGEMNTELVIKGFLDALHNRPFALPENELKTILLSIAGNLEAHQKNELNKIVSKNKKEEEEFFERNKGIKGVRAFPSGIQYQILNQGSGTNSPRLSDTVTIHYRGSLFNGTTFANTYELKRPLTFEMKNSMPGLSEPLKRMKMGDKWKLFIPSKLAYGEKGNLKYNIQPGASIIVEMELLSVISADV